VVSRIVVVLIAFVAIASYAQERPVVVAMPGGVVAISLPASMLQNAEVRRQLGSGLTTTIVVVAHEAEANVDGAARIEIRYDLWDEIYRIRKVDLDRRVEQARVTVGELERWWRATQLRVLTTSASRARLQFDVSVLPFSAAEQQDARQWLTKSGGVAGPRGGAANGSGIVDALIGTTISARPLVTWRWTAELAMKSP
jgi:hypothetical protein